MMKIYRTPYGCILAERFWGEPFVVNHDGDRVEKNDISLSHYRSGEEKPFKISMFKGDFDDVLDALESGDTSKFIKMDDFLELEAKNG